jgi:hypothetical protein
MSKKKCLALCVVGLAVAALCLAVCAPCTAPATPLPPSVVDASIWDAAPVDARACPEPDGESEASVAVPDAALRDPPKPYCFARKHDAKEFCALALRLCAP